MLICVVDILHLDCRTFVHFSKSFKNNLNIAKNWYGVIIVQNKRVLVSFGLISHSYTKVIQSYWGPLIACKLDLKPTICKRILVIISHLYEMVKNKFPDLVSFYTVRFDIFSYLQCNHFSLNISVWGICNIVTLSSNVNILWLHLQQNDAALYGMPRNEMLLFPMYPTFKK